MRIALVACRGRRISATPGHGYPDTGAAGADRITSLAQTLAQMGHRVTIYARRDSAKLPASLILSPGASLEYVTAGPLAPAKTADLTAHLQEFASYLAKRWRHNHPDVVDAHFWTSGLAALAATRGLDVPLAQTFTSLQSAEERYGVAEPGDGVVRRRLEAAVARTANVLLASSAHEASDLARLGAPRARIRVVPSGVDTELFTPDGPAAGRAGRPRLVAAQPLTATDDLVVALQVLAEIPDAELVITGGPGKGSLTRDPAHRAVTQTARKLGVADRLVFTGRIAPADRPALLRSADLMLSTARYEPVGTAAIRAMACGTPVISCGTGAEQDAVVDRTTGEHAALGQPSELARQVRKLLASPVRLEAYGIAAADRAKSRYGWDRIARETVAAYESLLPRSVAPAPQAIDDGEAEADEETGAAAPSRRVRAGTRS